MAFFLPSGVPIGRSRGGGAINLAGGRGAGMNLEVTIVGLTKDMDIFRVARREVNARLRDSTQAAGVAVLLPEMRRQFPKLGGAGSVGLTLADFTGGRRPRTRGALAPGAMARSLYIKRDRVSVYVGSRLSGKLNRALGWIDFGGIRPRDTTFRQGPHVILNVLDEKRDELDAVVLSSIMHAFDGLEHVP